MKVKIKPLDFPLPHFWGEHIGHYSQRMYVCEYRFHWWQRWRTINDPQTKCPQLFESPEEVDKKLNELGFEIK